MNKFNELYESAINEGKLNLNQELKDLGNQGIAVHQVDIRDMLSDYITKDVKYAAIFTDYDEEENKDGRYVYIIEYKSGKVELILSFRNSDVKKSFDSLEAAKKYFNKFVKIEIDNEIAK